MCNRLHYYRSERNRKTRDFLSAIDVFPTKSLRTAYFTLLLVSLPKQIEYYFWGLNWLLRTLFAEPPITATGRLVENNRLLQKFLRRLDPNICFAARSEFESTLIVLVKLLTLRPCPCVKADPRMETYFPIPAEDPLNTSNTE